jgi:hypothetical protein
LRVLDNDQVKFCKIIYNFLTTFYRILGFFGDAFPFSLSLNTLHITINDRFNDCFFFRIEQLLQNLSIRASFLSNGLAMAAIAG